jgi:hypothetical protein
MSVRVLAEAAVAAVFEPFGHAVGVELLQQRHRDPARGAQCPPGFAHG